MRRHGELTPIKASVDGSAGRVAITVEVIGIVYRVIAKCLIKKAGVNCKTTRTGAVTLIQQFGSALNLKYPLPHAVPRRGVCRWPMQARRIGTIYVDAIQEEYVEANVVGCGVKQQHVFCEKRA